MNYVETHDKANVNLLWNIPVKTGLPQHLTKAVQNLYIGIQILIDNVNT
jgi:hypothetical protein